MCDYVCVGVEEFPFGNGGTLDHLAEGEANVLVFGHVRVSLVSRLLPLPVLHPLFVYLAQFAHM